MTFPDLATPAGPASVNGTDIRVTVAPLADGAHLEPGLETQWRALAVQAAPSFFQSWGWIGCWLRNLPREIRPSLLVARAGSETVGLAVLVAGTRTRHGFLRARALHLNETGDPRFDCLTIEYNAILARRGWEDRVARCCLRALAGEPYDWEELYLGAVAPVYRTYCHEIGADAGLTVRIVDDKVCPHVDLDTLRQSGKSYLDLLSANTRHQIRRARRGYERSGPLTLEAAASLDEALAFLSGLKDLHQAYWTARGAPGAFANPFFERFHRALITDLFAAGQVQLLRICAGGRPIGYLYNLVQGGRVHNYQSGFAYGPDARLKPGLVSHALAVEHNLARGASCYDFMAGDSRYKRSLATGTDHLVWLVVQRSRLKFRLEHALRAMRNCARRNCARGALAPAGGGRRRRAAGAANGGRGEGRRR